MRALIPAIAMCAVLHAAAAPQQPMPAATTVAVAAPQQGELHAQLVTTADGVPAAQRHTELPVKSSLQSPGATQAGDSQEQRPTTAPMLLAALALMTGIALRRWGSGQR